MNGRSIWNGTRTHNHLIRKRTLNHLAKASLDVRMPVWLNGWVFVYELTVGSSPVVAT